MTLHVFNPEHDLALAAGLANFTSPRAGRQLRHDLGFLPVLWAADGDVVLVDDVEEAARALDAWHALSDGRRCRLADRHQLSALNITEVEPWGWDAALCAQLRRWGVSEALLPSPQLLDSIRQLSHRRTSASLLSQLQTDGTVGMATECNTVGEALRLVSDYGGQAVMKAPWSSSGRGVRFDFSEAWVQGVISRQGSVMVEPYYQKVLDFGMEFTATDSGIRYDGLSLFHTRGGAYMGNMLAPEQTKRDRLAHYLPLSLIDSVRQNIVAALSGGQPCGQSVLDGYRGPFGIDMMVVASRDGGAGSTVGTSFLLHPCVELNLRRTMGHVALALTANQADTLRVMRITYEGTYKLSIAPFC